MFRKLWKTVKFFLITGIVIICLPHSILPKQTQGFKKDDLEKYIKLNDSEDRLNEYKDDEDALRLKLEQLEVINNSRRKYNAPTVKLDILASRVANKISREAGENDFLGHWNLKGESPYMRYAFAGGNDHVSENAFGEWTTGKYVTDPSNISSMMKDGHSKFMAEKAPMDGHKKNIIDKSHNFVGIGYYISGKQFRYYEEFIDRYFDFENIPSEVKADQQFNLTIKTRGDGYLYYLVVYRGDLPKPMKPDQISRKGSYEDFTHDTYLRMTAWELAGLRNGFEYKIPLSFSKEGLYYIQVFNDRKEISSPAPLNTAGKTPCSGIVIKVVR